MNIPLNYEHLFYIYFVRRSVGKATNGRNVKIQKHDFFVCYSDSFFCEDSSGLCASILDKSDFFPIMVSSSVQQVRPSFYFKHVDILNIMEKTCFF